MMIPMITRATIISTIVKPSSPPALSTRARSTRARNLDQATRPDRVAARGRGGTILPLVGSGG